MKDFYYFIKLKFRNINERYDCKDMFLRSVDGCNMDYQQPLQR